MRLLAANYLNFFVRCLTLVAFVLTLIPISLPNIKANVSTFTKQSTTAYPCQDSPCGCNSAEKCWTSCCCKTPKQRSQWARENHVTPPTYAVLCEDKTAGSERDCCAKKTNAMSKSISTVSKQKQPNKYQPTKEQTTKKQIGWFVLECQGIKLGIASVPVFVAGSSFELNVIIPLIQSVVEIPRIFNSVFLEVSIPPPKRSI